MTQAEMTAAFDTAYTEYTSMGRVAYRPPIDRMAAQYFFFSGSEFGLSSGAHIYSETFGRPSPLAEDDVEGVAI